MERKLLTDRYSERREMLTEKRVREIVREEIQLLEKEKEIGWLNRSDDDYPLITPSWGKGEAFPKVRKQVKENLAQKE